MNFSGKTNKFDSSRNYKFSSTIPHNKCTMYKVEPKDFKRKKPSWRISGHTHNGRKREGKNHGFNCILENLPYTKFNMYLRAGWVLTFILIVTGTTIDLPHFFLQLLTSTCKSVIQKGYAHKASKDNYYFLHQLAKFLQTFVHKLVVCVCVGGTSGPTIQCTNVCKFLWLCTAISLLDSKKSLSNLAASQILRHFFQPCWQFIAH